MRIEAMTNPHFCFTDSFMREAGTWRLYEVLTRNEWNIAASARELNVNRTHFFKMMKKYGITRALPEQGVRMSPQFRQFMGQRIEA